MKKLIEFQGVTKQYKLGDIIINALTGVDFVINEGEFVIILGASGAGKSTILNILGGMDKATSGNVLIGNKDITNFSDKEMTKYRRENVGFIFQFYNLITNLTAIENVDFAAEVCKNHLDPVEILDRVGLGERSRNFPSQLSGGEQQRVAIARAIAKNPMILLCDEPTGALDYVTGKKILTLLEEINKEYHQTVILVTHNSLIAPMADKIIHVKSGSVESVVINQTKTKIEELEW